MESNRHLYSAKFSCQLAVTEYDYTNESVPKKFQCVSRKTSLVNPVKRKVTPYSTKLEKAHSFAGKKDLLDDHKKEKLQRKSYAGSEFSLNRSFRHQDNPIDRRRSMIDLNEPIFPPPERVISKMNIGFTKTRSASVRERKSSEKSSIDDFENVEEASQTKIDNSEVLDALIGAKLDEVDAVEIANKALDWERECLSRYHEFGETDADIDKMLEVTKNQEALMAFYYCDENNRIKVTEIFNIPDKENTNDADDEDGFPQTTVKPRSKSSLSAPIHPPRSPHTPKRQRKFSVVEMLRD